ncbi:hypothetical protein HWV62_32559 [Athelia sp. TMB]|nr:hypothetical protein HWV62_32559 [Athelia sp. TMB]
MVPALTGLFSALYLTVHQNVPQPDQNFVQQTLTAAQIILVTLVFPEWTLSWAVRSYFVAKRVRDQLVVANNEAMLWWYHFPTYSRPFAFQHHNRHNFRQDQKCNLTHAYFVVMGGLHVYNERGRPVGPVTVPDALENIRAGRLVLPPLDAIQGLSQSSTLSTLFALLGLLSFVIPSLARIHEGIPLAGLELMVLAHTIIATVTFLPWWKKPMNVGSPIRVSEEAYAPRDRFRLQLRRRTTSIFAEHSLAEVVYCYIIGTHDTLYDIQHAPSVPTFWSGETDSALEVPVNLDQSPTAPRSAYYLGSICALIATIVYGVIHCVGWHYDLPSRIELYLWRIGALLVVSAPTTIIIAFIACIFPLRYGYTRAPGIIMQIVVVPCAVVYVVGRLLLFAVVCSSLRKLAPRVFLQGSFTFIPF